MNWADVPGHIIFIISLCICFIVGEGIIIKKLFNILKKKSYTEESLIAFFRNFWGSFVIYVIATSIIALFIASFISKQSVLLNDINTWVSLILGMVALIIGIISLFLSFYNVDQSVQAQNETLKIIRDFKDDMVKEMYNLKKDIESKIESSSKETRDEIIKGRLSRSTDNYVKKSSKGGQWEVEE